MIVAVTACSAGIASTYLAAEALERAAKKRGLKIKVETQGTMGVRNQISVQEAQAADAVIIAADIHLKGMERFEGKPIVRVGVTEAITKAGSIIDKVEELLSRGRIQQ